MIGWHLVSFCLVNGCLANVQKDDAAQSEQLGVAAWSHRRRAVATAMGPKASALRWRECTTNVLRVDVPGLPSEGPSAWQAPLHPWASGIWPVGRAVAPAYLAPGLAGDQVQAHRDGTGDHAQVVKSILSSDRAVGRWPSPKGERRWAPGLVTKWVGSETCFRSPGRR